MSTADVRIEGSAGKQTASLDAERAEGSLDETAETGGARDDAAEPGQAEELAEAGEEDGAWDDGLIARRARGAAVPGERQAWQRAGLWGEEDGPASPGLGGDEETGWEFAGAAGPPSGRAAASHPGNISQDSSTRGKSADHPSAEWSSAESRRPQAYWRGTRDGESTQDRRVAALRRLVDLSRSRIPARVLAEAQRVLDAACARGQLPGAYTTVAIAGATGSGKSSLFNALAGTRLSQAGMRRPTTSTPVACSWEVPGAGPADGLLDRLAIPPSTRRFMRPESDWRGRIDSSARSELEGLVLIDLPDHDSAAEGHREQVDRLLRLVDAVVWVVDPEKYADAVLHERYLRPLAGYAEVTFIVLNQTDRLPGDATGAVLNDLRRLLDEDGMALGEHGEPGARVLATSALVGEGIDELRTELGAFVADRTAAGLRLSADLDGVVERLRPVYAAPGSGSPENAPAGLTEEVREGFADQLACAAGAVSAGRAAERAWLRHAQRACGTPWSQLQHWYDERQRRASGESELTAGSLRTADSPDTGADTADTTDTEDAFDGTNTGSAAGRSADAPAAAGAPVSVHPRVARPAVAHAVRTVVDQAAAGLPAAWRRSVRDAAWRGAAGLPEALDETLSTPPGSGDGGEDAAAELAQQSAGVLFMRRPVWWTLALVGQLGLLALQVLGAVLVLGTVLGKSVGEEWMGVALLIGGTLGGSLLAWGCRFAARGPAAAYGQHEELRLRRLVAGSGQVRVLEPVA
ncbi:MAG TPA: GTPase, partial [Streptomyces sp.]|nr:GTPase [Streptomyces sp.]